MAIFGALGAGILGSAAGQAAGSAMGKALGGGSGGQQGIQFSTPNFVNQINSLLQNTLNSSLGQYNNYLGQATNTVKNYLGQSTNAVNTGLTNATNTANQYAQQGFNQYQALNSPVVQTGYNALDAYSDSLGIARPQMGSGQLANQLFTATQAQPYLQQVQKAGQLQNLGAAPVQPRQDLQSYYGQLTPQQIQDFIQQHTTYQTGPQGYGTQYHNGNIGMANGAGMWTAQDIANQRQNAQATLAQPLYQQAQNKYNTQLSQYNTQTAQQQQAMQAMQQLQNMGYNPQMNNLFNYYVG